MNKRYLLILPLLGLLLFAGAGCSLFNKKTTDTGDTKVNVEKKNENKSETDKNKKDASVQTVQSPVEMVTEVIAQATTGNESEYKKHFATEVEAKLETYGFPNKDGLKNTTVEYGPPLEFGDGILVKAALTTKTGTKEDTQRFVFFLTRGCEGNDCWQIYDIKKGGAAAGKDNTITQGSVEHAKNELNTLKEQVEKQGYWVFRRDPYLTALADSIELGLDPHEDAYTLKDQKEKGEGSGTGEADVEVVHNFEFYMIRLIQPLEGGEKGIWVINSVTKSE